MKKRKKNSITNKLLTLLFTSVFFIKKGIKVSATQSSDVDIQVPTIDKSFLSEINPLEFLDSETFDSDSKLGDLISQMIKFAFPIAGIILFVLLVWGGFEVLVGAADKQRVDQGKKRITSAIIGFLVLFSSFWIAQILELMFDISIIG